MRPGGGAAKGGSYERKLARALSLWWYSDPNYLWRRPGSGHRSNMPGRHTGDIVPIADSGSLPHTWPFHVEAKSYSKARLKLGCLLWPKRNPIQKIWRKAIAEKRKDLVPLLILKSNNTDPVAVMRLYEADMLLEHLNRKAATRFFETYVMTANAGERIIIFPWLEVQRVSVPYANRKKLWV